jgi:hypothetical protein
MVHIWKRYRTGFILLDFINSAIAWRSLSLSYLLVACRDARECDHLQVEVLLEPHFVHYANHLDRELVLTEVVANLKKQEQLLLCRIGDGKFHCRVKRQRLKGRFREELQL